MSCFVRDSTPVPSKLSACTDIENSIPDLAATGHLNSVKAIQSAFQNSVRQKPAHWIQISGASALAAAELADKSRAFGAPSDLVSDDLDGIADITSMIRGHPSRAVDNYVLDVAKSTPSVNTALVFPPIIYGQGRGPVNQRSIQIPQLARATLERGRGVRVGAGLSRWGDVHVHDVSALILRLLERAVEGPADERLWNENGISFDWGRRAGQCLCCLTNPDVLSGPMASLTILLCFALVIRRDLRKGGDGRGQAGSHIRSDG